MHRITMFFKALDKRYPSSHTGHLYLDPQNEYIIFPLNLLVLLCSLSGNHCYNLLIYLPTSLVLIRFIVPVGNLKCKFDLISLRPSVAPYFLKNQDKAYALFINSHSTFCYIKQLVSSSICP